MQFEFYLAYVAACFVAIVVPGPTVTLIIANSLTHGTRAGLLNVAGSQVAVAIMVATLVFGLSTIIASIGWWFDWIRIIGAVYLVWIGWKLLRASGKLEAPGSVPAPRGGFMLQGFLVMASNPKTLLFFGAFIPQFVDPAGNTVTQAAVLGLTAMAVGIASDGAYALVTGRTGALLSRRRVALLNRVSGVFLISGGAWLALTRVR
jgi:threonine/homoserine/homoserine lactone efflux protein